MNNNNSFLEKTKKFDYILIVFLFYYFFRELEFFVA